MQLVSRSLCDSYLSGALSHLSLTTSNGIVALIRFQNRISTTANGWTYQSVRRRYELSRQHGTYSTTFGIAVIQQLNVMPVNVLLPHVRLKLATFCKSVSLFYFSVNVKIASSHFCAFLQFFNAFVCRYVHLTPMRLISLFLRRFFLFVTLWEFHRKQKKSHWKMLVW